MQRYKLRLSRAAAWAAARFSGLNIPGHNTSPETLEGAKRTEMTHICTTILVKACE